MTDFTQIEKNCGYIFSNKGLLKKALTLSSYGADNNESLECLGDALLTFIVAEKYFLEGATESEITLKKQQLLSDEALRPVSIALGLDGALIRDRGDTGNKKAVPSAYEALVAAIYLDGGMESAKSFALKTLSSVAAPENYVGELKELLEKHGKSLPPFTKTDLGTPQKHLWQVSVTVEGKTFTGEDANSDAAKKQAAKAALAYLKKKNN